MNMTNEQIQALKAAAESVIREHGEDWFKTGSQAHTCLKSKINLIAAANPVAIISLLAEREADKALIAELQVIRAAAEKLVRCKGRFHSEQNYRALAALFGVNTPDLPPLDSEARTLTVKLPESVIDAICLTAAEIHNLGRGVSDDRAQEIINSIRCAAGIPLVVGGE